MTRRPYPLLRPRHQAGHSGRVDAADLYLLPPEDFTAARDAAAAQARADGDRPAAAALKALRRPSVAAWVVNRLATEDVELLESLLSLGPELAEAQAAGSGDLLRELGAQRRSLVEAITDRAVVLAGRTVAPAVRAEVSGTLEAALADPHTAQAVRSGRLVRALSYAGFGGVDLEGAVAGPAEEVPAAGRADAPARRPARAKKAGPTAVAGEPSTAEDGAARTGDGGRTTPATGSTRAASGRRVATAEAQALAAAGELDDAVRTCERVSGEADRVAGEVQGAQEQAASAAAALTAAQQALRDAERAAKEAERSAEQAVRVAAQAEERHRATARLGEQAVERVRTAQLAAERSRAALDALRRTRAR